jgi:tetratricopeptide (TPR) repeat protein
MKGRRAPRCLATIIYQMNPGANFSIEQELRGAKEAYDRGDYSAANERCDLVLRVKPTSPEAHLGKGMIAMAQGDNSKALDSYINCLRSQPQQPEALYWAATLNLTSGNPLAAEKFARTLAEVQPMQATGFFLLASALKIQNRNEDALRAINRALQLEPNDPNSIVTKARLCSPVNPVFAMELYRKALRLRPNSPAAIDMAELLLKEGNVNEALKMLQQVTPHIPERDRPYALLAQCYTESHVFDLAEKQWSLAHRHSSKNPTLLLQNRARAEISAGRLEIAEEILDESIQRDPEAFASYVMFTAIKKISDEDAPFVEKMERLLSSEISKPKDLVHLNFALGKAYNDLADYAKAMRFYDEANRLNFTIHPERKSFHPSQLKAFTDFQIEYFTKQKIRKLASEGLVSSLPIFIVGMMRSGTTLSEQILSSHSTIKDGGEQSFWQFHLSQMVNPNNPAFDLELGKKFGRQYLEILAAKDPTAQFVIDKNPGNFAVTAPIHCILPNARFVHIKRHPVDNLLSMWMTPAESGLPYLSSKENLVFGYREYLRLFRHLEDVLPDNRFRTFSYEQITSHPNETIQAMLSYLELETEESCFAPEKNQRTVRTPSVYQVRQPISRASQERWRHYEPWLGSFAELL